MAYSSAATFFAENYPCIPFEIINFLAKLCSKGIYLFAQFYPIGESDKTVPCFLKCDISLTNQYDETKNAYNNFYSTLQETEVVSSAPNSIQAIIDYRFESYFNVYSESNDPTFAFTSQESEETFYGEYNVATKMGFHFFKLTKQESSHGRDM